MSPAVTAAAVAAVIVVLCAVALRSARRERFGVALVAVVLLGMVLRVYLAADLYLHEWDERYHVLVAKHLARHPLRPTLYEDPLLPYDARESFKNHVWLHKPPLALWVLALGVRLFGVVEPLVRLPSVALSSLAVALTYLLGRRLFDRRIGLLAAFFHAVNGCLIELCAGRRASDHVDSLLVVLVEAGVLLALRAAERGQPIGLALAIGLVTGLAGLTKSVPALLVLAVWAVLLARRPPEGGAGRAIALFALGLVVATAVALPWFVYVRLAFPLESAWESSYALRHLKEPLEGHGGTLLTHLAWMPRLFGEGVYLPVAWFLWRTVRGDREPGALGLATWLLLPYLVFSLVATKMPAYVMVAAPAVFLMEAAFVCRLAAMQSPRGRAVRAVLIGLLVLLPARSALDRLRPLLTDNRRRPWSEELRAVGKSLGGQRCVIFGTQRPVEAMFYTGCTAYEGLPGSPGLVQELERAGYRVLVLPSS